MRNLFYSPTDPQIRELLYVREMRIENLLNKIRAVFFFLILVSDIIERIVTKRGSLKNLILELLILALLFSIFYLIHHLTLKNKTYSWIKYFTVTFDLVCILIYTQYALKYLLLPMEPLTFIVVISIMLIFFNTLSVLRGGIKVIIYSGFLTLSFNCYSYLIYQHFSIALLYTSVLILFFTIFNLYSSNVLIQSIVNNQMLKSTMDKLNSAIGKIEVQNEIVVQQKDKILHQNKEIGQSITYALRIQTAILPPDYHVKKCLPDSFIMYLPKDVVSGDFYYVDQVDDNIIFSAVDCTGHGVPGAMMSVIGYTILDQAVKLKRMTKPSDILQFLDSEVTKILRQMAGESGVNDGMDLALCTLNIKTKEVQFAGAYNSMVYIHKGELLEIVADKFPIGSNFEGIADNYTNHSVQLESGDLIYLYSDGYADQFGGPKDKKFKYNQLREMLLANHKLTMEEQCEKLHRRCMEWKGDREQTDDILVIGVKIL
jgi:serine phosphatase RsbU (regulator of sigma subunit)